ncbi:MAG: AAA family ATPase [Myxococcota bacterium]
MSNDPRSLFQLRPEPIASGALSEFYLSQASGGGRVVVKILRPTVKHTPLALEILRRDYAALSGADSLRIVPVVAYRFEPERCHIAYATPGSSEPLDRVRMPLSEEAVASIAFDLARALQDAHRHRVLHLGLRPANVLVWDLDTDRPHAQAFDFGTSRLADLQQDPTRLRYVAPEQVGAFQGRVDHRSDLFALGALLYELWTGAPPFFGDDAAATIHQLVARKPTDPRELRPDSSESMHKIIMRLLEKRPEDRYDSAQALALDLRSLSGGTEDLPSSGLASRGRRPADAILGRRSELSALSAGYARVSEGHGAMVFLAGNSGIGKSTLLEEFRRATEARGAVFIAGNATEFERHLPLSPLVGALEELAGRIRTAAKHDPSCVERLRVAIGDPGEELLKVVPTLRDVLGPLPEPPELEPERKRQRLFGLIIDFLVAAGGVFGKPLVVSLDNLQWGDPGVFELLWVLANRLEDAPLMLIGAYRSDDASNAGVVRLADEVDARFGTPTVTRLHLRPLEGPETASLIHRVLGEVDALEPLSALVHKLSQGNPLHVRELIKAMIADGTISRRDGEARVDLLRLEHVPLSSSLDELIARRLSVLGEAGAEILGRAAILGSWFNPEELYRIADAGKSEVELALARAFELELIEHRALSGRTFSFVHDRIREQCIVRVPPRHKAEIHERIGRDLLASARSDEATAFAIAHHLSLGLEPRTSVPHLLNAAAIAKERYANTQAVAFYERALELLGDSADAAQRLSLHESRADCLNLVGKYDGALEGYRTAAEIARAQADLARLEGKIGDVYFRTGNNPSAIEHLEHALENFGELIPRGRAHLLWSIAKEAAVQLAHTLRRVFRLPRLRAPVFIEQRSEVSLIYSKLAYAWYFINLERSANAHLRQLNIAERLPESNALAQAYSSHGIVASTVPAFDRALNYAEESLAMREKLGHVWGTGQSSSFLGVVHYYRAAYANATKFLRRSIEILENLGDQWEIEASWSHLYFTFRLTGDFDAGLDACGTLLRLSQEIRDLKFQSVAWSGFGKLFGYRGRFEKALDCLRRALDLDPDNMTRAFTLCTRGQVMLRQGDVRGALEALDQSVQVIEQHKLRNDYVVETYVAYGEAFMTRVERESRGSKRRLRALVRTAKPLVRRALRVGKSFPNYWTPACVVAARLAAIQGQEERARRYFEEAIAHATRLGQRYELARARSTFGRWLMSSPEGEEAGRSELEAAVETFRSLSAQHDLQQALQSLGLAVEEHGVQLAGAELGERRQIASLFKVSELVSSIRDVEVLLDKVMDIAIEATGAERGFLMLADQTEASALSVRAARSADRRTIDADRSDVRKGIIESVQHTREPRVVTMGEVEGNESYDGAASHSVLCVPIKREDRLIGLMYMDNRLVGDLFTQHDVEVLSSFAALVAVTIENAYAYRRIEELNASLEERIRDRTKALRESEELHRRSIDEANDAIFAFDTELGTVLSANRRAVEWSQAHSLEGLIGRSVEEIFDGDARAFTEFRSALHSRSAFHDLELTIRSLDPLPVSLSGSTIEVGSTTFVQVICRDLREQKRLQTQLLHTEKLASIGQLAAGVAHEIRNPLNGIALSAKAIGRALERTDLQKAVQKLGSIEAEVKRANQHISDLLAYSRPTEVEVTPVPLGQALDAVLVLVENQVSLDGIEVVREYAPDAPQALGDEHTFGQVFRNLIINAVHAMPAGGRLTLRVARAPDEPGMVRASIEDTGTGIAPEHLTRIFDPFFTTKEPGKGTGLGLAVCQSAIKKLRGMISVQSQLGVGTVFHVNVPMALVSSLSPARAVPALRPEGAHAG